MASFIPDQPSGCIDQATGALKVNVVAGGAGGNNPAAGPTGSPVPAQGDYTAFQDGSGNLVGVSAGNPLPITGSISASNPSVGTTGAAAPASATEIGSIDGSGNLQGASTDNPIPVAQQGSIAVTNANLDVALSTLTKPSDQQHAIIDSGTTVVTQATGTNLHVVVDTAPSTAVTNAGLSNLDVALSTRLKPADTLAAVTTVGTITNPVTVTGTVTETPPYTLGQKVMASSVPVAIASDQSAVPVSGTVGINNFPATQPVSAVSLPLPANAAQETGGNLATLTSLITQIQQLLELQREQVAVLKAILIQNSLAYGGVDVDHNQFLDPGITLH